MRQAAWRLSVGQLARPHPALAGELVEVRLHHDRRRGAQLGGGRVPGALEQPGPRALALVERDEQLALAVEAVLDVLIGAGDGVVDVGPMAGAEQLRAQLAHRAQRLEQRRQRAAVGWDEARALAED